MNEAMKLLKRNKHKLTKQQYRTFKGQILHDDIIGFYKGFLKVINASNSKKILK